MKGILVFVTILLSLLIITAALFLLPLAFPGTQLAPLLIMSWLAITVMYAIDTQLRRRV